jgi:hypothetical protein
LETANPNPVIVNLVSWKTEDATLIEYVQALGGTLEIRVTVKDHTYTEQLA